MKKIGILVALVFLGSTLLTASSFAAGEKTHAGGMTMQSAYKISDLMDKTVRNQQGEKLGKVENLVIGKNGQVKYVILSPEQRLLKEEDHLVAIPWDAVHPRVEREDLTVNISRQDLQNAPSFAKDDWQQLNDPDWDRKVNAYFEEHAGMVGPEERMREEGMEHEGGMMEEQSSRQSDIRYVAAYESGSSAGSPFGSLQNMRINKMMGASVENRSGQELGTIEDVVFAENGRIKYLILARGGVLGIGEELVAVPWSAVRASPQLDTLLVNISPQRLENAPSFSSGDWSQLDNPRWESRVNAYFGTEQQLGETPSRYTGAMRTSELIGGTVRNRQGEELGTIRELITTEDGRIKYAVLAPESSFNMGDRLVAIPWSALEPNIEQREVIVDISRSKLENAPTFTKENWRDYVNNPRFDSRVYSYFGVSGLGGELPTERPYYGPEISSLRASEVIGERVRNRQGQRLGKIEDLVAGENGQIKYLILAPDSAMRMGDQLIAIPWNAVQPNIRDHEVIINLSQSRLRNAPGFPSNNWGQLDNPRFDNRVNSYFGTTTNFRGRQHEPFQGRQEGWY